MAFECEEQWFGGLLSTVGEAGREGTQGMWQQYRRDGSWVRRKEDVGGVAAYMAATSLVVQLAVGSSTW